MTARAFTPSVSRRSSRPPRRPSPRRPRCSSPRPPRLTRPGSTPTEIRTSCSRPRPTSCSTAAPAPPRTSRQPRPRSRTGSSGVCKPPPRPRLRRAPRRARGGARRGRSAATRSHWRRRVDARWPRSATAPSTSPSPRRPRATSQHARGWLLIRDFRQATRFTRPGSTPPTALDQLPAGETTPEEAVTGVRKDLLDAYQARLVTYLDEAEQADERGLHAGLRRERRARRGLLADPRARVPGAAQLRRAQGRRTQTSPRSRRRRRPATGGLSARHATDALDALDGFTAAPFTPEEQSRRAHQLTRFLDLIPVEYDRGTERRRSHARVRDPGGGRLHRGRQVRLQRPRVASAGARPRRASRPSMSALDRAGPDHGGCQRGPRGRLARRGRGGPRARPATPSTR